VEGSLTILSLLLVAGVTAFDLILGVAEDLGKPIGVNLPTPNGNSRSIFLATPSWSGARLAGWIAGHHEMLEQQFGPATVVDEGTS